MLIGGSRAPGAAAAGGAPAHGDERRPVGGDEDEVVSTINTTPLVDVMLVLLIIFLITIPVVTHTIPVELPKERNQPRKTKPENIMIVRRTRTATSSGTDAHCRQRAADRPAEGRSRCSKPQPEVHIRGDGTRRYEFVGRVVFDCQRAGIVKVAFITEPPPRGPT